MLDVGDRVEVTDEASPLYHSIGTIIAFTRGGRPVVRFARRHRTLRHPLRGAQRTRVMAAEQVDPVSARV